MANTGNPFEKFSEPAQMVLSDSYQLMNEQHHSQLDVEHILMALIKQPNGIILRVFEHLSVDTRLLTKAVQDKLDVLPKLTAPTNSFQVSVYITARLQSLLNTAEQEREQLGDDFISPEHLLLGAIANPTDESALLLRRFDINHANVVAAVQAVRAEQPTNEQVGGKYKTLEKYSVNLTELARIGKLDLVIGREQEIRRVMEVLSRRSKNNPVLIGEPGVGKTAIAEGLAQKIVSGDVPDNLRDKIVVALDIPGLVAGSKLRGEFEERLKGVIDEVRGSNGEIIMFIDELHTVVGAGSASGSMDAANILKPALARGELQTLGATTLDEYRKYIEKDAALERRFAPVMVDEPSVTDTIQMLRGLRPKYEEHHKVKITDEALVAAANLSDRYISDRFLPDKAIDLMDEAASLVRMNIFTTPPEIRTIQAQVATLAQEMEAAALVQDYEQAARLKYEHDSLQVKLEADRAAWLGEKQLDDVVDEEDIATVVAKMTGIPAGRMLEGEMKKLLQMEEHLHSRVVGQDEAIAAVSDAIRRARSGLRDPNRPIGSFIFLGPTGVGKTELVKALAEFLFDSEDAMVRIDMSEYGERHSVSRLIGSPPGYVGYDEGGQLTEAVRRKPYQIVLFDEIEKAHPEIFNTLLQLLDDGRLTDGQGRTVDFKNTVVIMTSNVGTESIRQRALGFNRSGESEEKQADNNMKQRVMDELRQAFRPEFLNRVDEIIIFSSLTQSQIKQIVGLMMQEVVNRLAAQGMELRVTEDALNFFAREGFDRVYGARPLRRVIQRKLENQLSKLLLDGQFMAGDVILADINPENKLELIFAKGEGRANLPTFTPESSSASKSTITSTSGQPSAPSLRMAA